MNRQCCILNEPFCLRGYENGDTGPGLGDRDAPEKQVRRIGDGPALRTFCVSAEGGTVRGNTGRKSRGNNNASLHFGARCGPIVIKPRSRTRKGVFPMKYPNLVFDLYGTLVDIHTEEDTP